MSNELFERYEKMEEQAMEEAWACDFREEVAEQFRYALMDGKGDITLKDFLVELEQWFKDM